MRIYSNELNASGIELQKILDRDFPFFVPLNKMITSWLIDETLFEDDFVVINCSVADRNRKLYGGYFKNKRDALKFKLFWKGLD